jgi:hypothetical protein
MLWNGQRVLGSRSVWQETLVFESLLPALSADDARFSLPSELLPWATD